MRVWRAQVLRHLAQLLSKRLLTEFTRSECVPGLQSCYCPRLGFRHASACPDFHCLSPPTVVL